MAELEGWELRTGRAHEAFVEESVQRAEEARSAVAAVLTTDPSHIALTHSTADGMNIATWAIDWKAGDRLVTTSLEHPGGISAAWSLRERFGVELVVADVGLGEPERVFAALDEAIVPGTRLVAVSHVSWATGARLPVDRIVSLAHERGALVAIDGAQAAGAIPIAVEEIGTDFYAASGQKWLCGPEGTGALYCASSVLDRPRTVFGSWWSFESFDLQANGRLWPDARRFEASTLHKPSVVGFARSCAWLAMFLGFPWIHERTARLAEMAVSILGDVPGVEVLTPRQSMAGIVTFRIDGWPAKEALRELSARTYAIARTVAPLNAIRISTGFFNTAGELGRFRDGVALLAAHTPDTLPQRARITVLQGGEE